MSYIDNIIFGVLLILGVGFFVQNLNKIKRNIFLGQKINRNDQSNLRWSNVLRVALGQSKMVKKPIAGIMHVFVYVGFMIINLELIEIIIDGVFGTHRFLSDVLGNSFYNVFTATLEYMALLVLVAVVVFFIRRNLMSVHRFKNLDLRGWPLKDANWILLIEFCLMIAFFKMNAADYQLQMLQSEHYSQVGSFPISRFLMGSVMSYFNEGFLIFIERASWWFHFIGILLFMNYLYFSKHLHIILAFPNTYFANLNPKGQLSNPESVTKEIKLMMDPNADPYATTAPSDVPSKFGASDVFDLNRVQLLNAYTCTECGRCTESCPANITGKKLSPRKIMMSTRDRLEEVSLNIGKNKGFVADNKQLLDDHITREELWACTSCNACTEACPVLIDPLSIIIEMRRYLVMEQSAAPQELNAMMTNVENNSAPWQYNQADRLNWAND